ncbi:MAG: DUF4339 domain-containing protein [Tannerella sp.]|nr:DUF4339 domain-containing protein [Tannerella sp.]
MLREKNQVPLQYSIINEMTNNVFYIIINGEQSGPYTYDELKSLSLKRDSFVWHQGMKDWDKAENIERLKSFFDEMPPPIPKQFTNPSQNANVNTSSPINVDIRNTTREENRENFKNDASKVIASEFIQNLKLIGIAISITLVFLTGFYFIMKPPISNLTDLNRYKSRYSPLDKSSMEINDIKDELSKDTFPKEEKSIVISKDDYKAEMLQKIAPNTLKPQRELIKEEDMWTTPDEIPPGWGESKYDDPMHIREVMSGERSLKNMRMDGFKSEMEEKGILCLKISLIVLILGRYLFLFGKWISKNLKSST